MVFGSQGLPCLSGLRSADEAESISAGGQLAEVACLLASPWARHFPTIRNDKHFGGQPCP
jgi:hypothetical protein